MKKLPNLFENNRAWSEGVSKINPDFFAELAAGQHPEHLWIGCADSRVPESQILGLKPGSVFVHRNIANLVVHSDLSCLSVMEYAVGVLGVKHIIVCGHYGCGGVAAALGDEPLGLIDNWLRHIRDVRDNYWEELSSIEEHDARVNRLCELNVAEQVRNVGHTPIVQRAWREGQPLCLHGWIYGLQDGLLHDLDLCVTGHEQLLAAYQSATHRSTA